MYYRLDKTNTQWVFILTSVAEPDDKHLHDINFGVNILLLKNVPFENITLIIDGNHSNIKKIIKPSNKKKIKIFNPEDFKTILSCIKKDFIVLSVFGHGNLDGLAAKVPIKPHIFINTIKSVCSAKEVFILLGSCYAGIFNYPNTKLKGRFFTPNIVITGATNLTKSISIPIGSYGNNWEANIMLFAFFAAIKMAIDIDGDGHFSFIDAFKYMTYVVNECCLEIEKIQRLTVVNTIREYELFIETLKGKLDTDITQEEKQKKEEMEKTLQMDYIHQEPWILNAESAIYTDICL